MSTTTQETESIPFSRRVRQETKKIHTMAERCTFMRGFLRGAATKKSYRTYLAGFRKIYRTLEQCLERQRNHPVVKEFYFPELHRATAIEKDLAYFGGAQLETSDPFTENWCEKLRLRRWGLGEPLEHEASLKAVFSYCQHLEKIESTNPAFLVPHAYTRYMGDLSGGQILARIAAKSMGLDPARGGLSFYHFPEIQDHEAFKWEFRRRMDALEEHGPEFTQNFIDETIQAFRLNIAFFETLKGNALLSAWRQIWPQRIEIDLPQTQPENYLSQ
ncbi:MAG: biliverdin-producing heme oxygenase [Opitutales bacterium]|nr:biliverdin-producing heme oxygenase [Opitutales bacterium]